MAYNIPLTGQIRLGRDFNRMNYPSSSTFTEQISMNSQRVVKCHKGPYRYGTNPDSQAFNTNNGLGDRQISPINTAYNTQRQLYTYRGLCNSYTQAATIMPSATIVQDPLKWWFYKAGASILNNVQTTSRWEWTGPFGTPNPGGTNSTWNPGAVVEYTSLYATTTANAAIANLMYIGYLEAGTYALNGITGKNDGSVEIVVRGYSGSGATGTSSDLFYKLIAKSTSDGFAWFDASSSGTYASQFTVNATYPYILLILQTNTANYSARWCVSSTPNMHTTSWFYSSISSKYWVEPHITRLS